MTRPMYAGRSRLAGMLLIVCTACWPAGPSARQAGGSPPRQPERQLPALTFKVEVNYVEVDAVVLDRAGEFVADLRQSDFQILEDGKPQTISAFGLVQIPVERAEAPLFLRHAIEPDVQTNVKPFDGRLYVLLLDELHTTALNSVLVRRAARAFIQNTLGANDLAAVVSTRGNAAQDFTNNRRLLMAAVDRFMGTALPPATLNRIDSYNAMRDRPGGVDTTPKDADEFQRAYHATTTLTVIRNLSDFLAGVRGRRKALVLFSEGIDYDISDVVNNKEASSIIRDSADAIAAATRANVSIYSVDPRGLAAMAGMSADMPAPPVDADPALKLGPTGLQEEVRVQHDSLRVLAEETGGTAFINSNDTTAAFDRIRQDNSAYYVLGYNPGNARRDGRYRRLEVRVTRPGLEVRARRGYVAPRGKVATPPVEAQGGTSQVLRDVLSSPVPIPGLRLTASAVPFKGKGQQSSILLVVHADGRDLVFVERSGRLEDALELSVIAVDGQAGKVVGGVRHKLSMPLKPKTQVLVAQTGVQISTRFDLRPGRYQLRIGGLTVNGRRAGTVHYDLDVPNFDSEPIAMSGLAITASSAAGMPTVTVDPDDPVRKALPSPPVVARTFRAGEDLTVLAEVYDNQGPTPHTVDITTTLRSDDGREVLRLADERSSRELAGGKGGYGHIAKVPLEGLAPGLYVLGVQARSRLGKGPTAVRETQIRVVG